VVEQTIQDRQTDRVDVLVVEAEAHARLTQADCVLALGDGVEFLELVLLDVLRGEVGFHGQDADVLGEERVVLHASESAGCWTLGCFVLVHFSVRKGQWCARGEL